MEKLEIIKKLNEQKEKIDDLWRSLWRRKKRKKAKWT